MSGQDERVGYDVETLKVLALAHRLERQDEVTRREQEELASEIATMYYRLRDRPARYGLDKKTAKQLDTFELARRWGRGEPRPLEAHEREAVLEILGEVARRMEPAPATCLAEQLAEHATYGDASGRINVAHRLDLLEHLPVELLDGLSEEDLLPALTHTEGRFRRRALAILGRLSGRQDDVQAGEIEERGVTR